MNNYVPTTWIGGKTVATADVMNNIEKGIANAYNLLSNASISDLAIFTVVNDEGVSTETIISLSQLNFEYIYEG